MDRWSIEQVRAHLGAASTGSARRTLSRLGVKAVAYEPGASGRAEARYDAQQVRVAVETRPGRGKRTDLAHRPHGSDGAAQPQTHRSPR